MDNDAFKNNILNTINLHDLIEKNDKVAVAVSGGPDSLSLLHFLHSNKDELGITVSALHINHMLRGSESDGDEKSVADFCTDMGIDLMSVSIDIGSYARARKVSVEEAGRDERYRVFDDTAAVHGFHKVALGHNYNDQAETVLLNLIRGTGPDGLSGMPYKRGRIIRPLLDTRRSAIEEYCLGNGLKPRTDSSNRSRRYMRNRVRLDLIPFIDRTFGTDIAARICSMSRLVREDSQYIDDAAAEVFKKVSSVCGEDLSVDTAPLSGYHPAIIKRVIRLAIEKTAGSLKGISGRHIEAVITLMGKSRTGSVVCLPAGIRATFSYGRLMISLYNEGRAKPEASVELLIPGVTRWPGSGFVVDAEVEEVEKAAAEGVAVHKNLPQQGFEQIFDYPAITKGMNEHVVSVRGRRIGDVFRPYGAGYMKKLKKYLVDEKIPRDQRDSLPLIACGNEIIWIVGHKMSDKFKTTENTKMLLRLRVHSSGENTDGDGPCG